MPFPTHIEIKAALQNPDLTFLHKKLMAAQLEDPDFAICDSGRYAVVSKIRLGGKSWALRIPIGIWPDSVDRYRMINDVAGSSTRALVDCQLLSQAMRVPVPNGPIYDVVVMEWIDGQNLSSFVRTACGRRDVQAISQVKESLLSVCSELQDLQMSHGDLSPLNILVVQSADKYTVKLVDYDFVSHPSLTFSTALPASPTRHPLRPITSDLRSDLFVFHLYDTVLEALQTDPSLIDRLDDYNDQTLFISYSDSTSESRANIEVLRTVAPERIAALEQLAVAPYSETPQPTKPFSADMDVILATDWRSLRRSIGSRVVVSGVVDSASGSSIMLTKPTRLNRSNSVLVVPRRGTGKRPTRGDRITVTGVARLEEKSITISDAELRVIDSHDDKKVSIAKSIRDHIASTASRIRQTLDQRPPLKIKPRVNTWRRNRSDSRDQPETQSGRKRPTIDRPFLR